MKHLPGIFSRSASAAFALCCLLVLGHPLAASDVRFRRVSVEEGLAQAAVHVILQDSDGFMWFGTRDGLSRFDGYDFTNFRAEPDDPEALSNGSIWALVEDADGFLWIGTEDGLSRYDPVRNSFSRYKRVPDETNNPADRVRALVSSNDGTLLVGTDRGLYRFDARAEAIVATTWGTALDAALETATINDLLVDRGGTTWIGTPDGLYAVSPNATEIKSFGEGEGSSNRLTSSAVFCLLEDHHGGLWVGTAAGLDRRPPGAERFETVFRLDPLADRLSRAHAWDLAEDAAGRIWVAANQLLILDAEGNRLGTYRHDPLDAKSLSWNLARSLFADADGLVWVGTNGYGLNLFDPGAHSIDHLGFQPGSRASLSADYVSCIFTDDDREIWVGTGDGVNLHLRDQELTRVFRHDPADPRTLSHDGSWKILRDSRRRLWIATSLGLNRYDGGGRFTRFLAEGPRLQIFDFVEAVEPGVFWLATNRGLRRFDPTTGEMSELRLGGAEVVDLRGERTTCVLRHGDVLWVGTSLGLNRIDLATGQTQRFVNDPGDASSLSNNFVKSLLVDSKERVWVGTWGGGLNRLREDGTSFVRIGQRHGLPSSVVYGILEDADGRLWMSTNRGISRIDPGSGTFFNLGFADGLQGAEFNTGAYCQSPSGRLYFGGLYGLDSFDPRLIRRYGTPPTTRITGMAVDGEAHQVSARSVAHQQPVELGWKQHSFEIDYVGILFTAAQKTRYTYLLEGFDEDWQSVGTRRHARYTRVPPGEYLFRVKAVNGDGVWDEEGASLGIIIRPAVWQTAWFRASVALVTLLLGLAGYKLRTRQLLGRNEALEARVDERTAQLELANRELESFSYSVSHNLRGPLRSINGYSHILSTDHEEQLGEDGREVLARIGRSTRLMAELIDDLLQLLRDSRREPVKQVVDLGEIAAEIVEALQRSEPRREVRIHIDDGMTANADPALMQVVLENLVGNAWKFTANQAEAQIAVVRTAIAGVGDAQVFSVRDNGTGFDMRFADKLFRPFERLHSAEDFPGTGVGLATVQRIVERHGGKVWAESAPGRGATFSFSL